MPRLSKETKELIFQQLKNNVSLNTISKNLSLNKSTIYYYYQKIKPRKNPPLSFTPKATTLEGEIIGIFAGDGSQYFDKTGGHYQVNVHFGSSDKEWGFYVQQLFRTFFRKTFQLNYDGNNGLRLRTNSKQIYHYFKHYLDYDSSHKHDTVKLKTLQLPPAFKISFLRGLVDTDGSVLYNHHDKSIRITFHTTSAALAHQISKMLSELCIASTYRVASDKRNYKPVHIIRIRTSDITKFLNTVHPFKRRFLKGL